MAKLKNYMILWVGVIVVLGVSMWGCKDHEHPTEHPDEHPAKTSEQTSISKDQLADAVEAYVAKESAGESGYFEAVDEKTGQTLQLKLDKVHRKRLSKVGDDLYFACADFTTPQGKVYDLDVFMKGKDKDSLSFSKFSIHKEDGVERYTWYEEDGIWKKKPVGKPTASMDKGDHPKEHPEEELSEHPEHPENDAEDSKEHPKEHPEEHPEEKPDDDSEKEADDDSNEHPSEHPE